MSEKSPAFRFYARDFLTSENQADMSLQEAGAYIRLICHCWLNGSLPNDIAKLAHRAGATDAQMRKFWPAVSKSFTLGDDGRWRHARLELERERQASYSARQSTNGGKGGRPKKNPDETHGFSDSIENGILTNTPKKPLANANAKANCSELVLRERGSGENLPLDRWFGELHAAYPPKGVSRGLLTEQAFMRAIQSHGTPEATFTAMLLNLETQKRGAQWLSGKIPRLDRWLSEGLWEQRHEAPTVTPRTAGTLAAAAEIMRGNS